MHLGSSSVVTDYARAKMIGVVVVGRGTAYRLNGYPPIPCKDIFTAASRYAFIELSYVDGGSSACSLFSLPPSPL